MKYYAVVNLGLEEVAKKEIEEKAKIVGITYPNIVEFSSPKIDLQAARRVLTAINKYKNLEDWKLPAKFPWSELFGSELTFKIEVEGVKGQENRWKISRKVAEKIFAELKTHNIAAKIEFKRPNILVIVFFNGNNYFMGIDQNVKELNSRRYRVFPHSASFKGDLAYYFVRVSRFKPKEKLLVGFCKDGAIAIEAHNYAKTKIYAFDEATPNVTAAKKNAKIAKAEVEIYKCVLDDLDVKYREHFFDRIIMHITTKDENKINEIYYQANYLLKPKGTLLLIGRENWEVSVSDKFKLTKKQGISKGDNVYQFLLLEKK